MDDAADAADVAEAGMADAADVADAADASTDDETIRLSAGVNVWIFVATKTDPAVNVWIFVATCIYSDLRSCNALSFSDITACASLNSAMAAANAISTRPRLYSNDLM